MTTKKQKLEISKLKQNALNRDRDNIIISEMLQKLADLGDVTDIDGENLTSVPASFADLAAVKTYLDIVIPEIETRLDNIETKINSVKDV